MKTTTIKVPDVKHYIVGTGRALKNAFSAFAEGFKESMKENAPVKVEKAEATKKTQPQDKDNQDTSESG